MKFEDLGLSEPILRGVHGQGYRTATPIQSQAIPTVLRGRDLMGCAQTGTGKTAAFALPTLQRLCDRPDTRPPNRGGGRYRGSQRNIRCLVLAPTRELAAQIDASFQCYGQHTGLRSTVVYGGVSQQRQVRALREGVDILVATPGRLLDLMNQGYIELNRIEVLILDEADQMLDMGFIHDLRRIVACVPSRRQTLMFSATMPVEIRKLADQWLCDPARVQVSPVATPAEKVHQSVYFVEPTLKSRLLTSLLQSTPSSRTLVFTRTKRGADRVAKQLQRAGIVATAIHGNKSQNVRQRVLAQFKSSQPPVLIATDIAARGLDVDGISHVINFDLPEIPEIYVHRIGRTGRAGASGHAVSFCGAEERPRLRRIERLTRRTIDVQKAPTFSGTV
jgi:ATP-dependent RNA helicase RhlE